MKNSRLFRLAWPALFLALAALLAQAQLARAKGAFARLTVAGGGLASEIVVTDETLLGFGALAAFPAALAEPPVVSGDGYLITRYEATDDGGYAAWDRLRYYPAGVGAAGSVLYLGLVNGGSEYDGHWFAATAKGEAAIARLLQARAGTAWPAMPAAVLFVIVCVAAAATAAMMVQTRAAR